MHVRGVALGLTAVAAALLCASLLASSPRHATDLESETRGAEPTVPTPILAPDPGTLRAPPPGAPETRRSAHGRWEPANPLDAWKQGDWQTTIRALRQSIAVEGNPPGLAHKRVRLLTAVLLQGDAQASVDELEGWLADVCRQRVWEQQPDELYSIWTEAGDVTDDGYIIRWLSREYNEFRGKWVGGIDLAEVRAWLNERLDRLLAGADVAPALRTRVGVMRDFLGISDGHLPGAGGATTEIRVARVLPKVRAFLAAHGESTEPAAAAMCAWLRSRYGKHL
jgi:hypothetical protein